MTTFILVHFALLGEVNISSENLCLMNKCAEGSTRSCSNSFFLLVGSLSKLHSVVGSLVCSRGYES